MNLFSFLNPHTLIATLGILGIFGIVFAETGLLIGFFLPGDSLLFVAGYLASAGHLSFGWLLIGVPIAAILGDAVGYSFGRKIGPMLFTREDSIFFNKKNIVRAQEFYEKHGKKTIILARFLPIIRTFAPIVAGIGHMEYRTFVIFNIIGGCVWSWVMLWLGYGFGSVIPDPDRYIIPVVLLLIALPVATTLREIFKKNKKGGPLP
jgi:membrane-associated protein